MRRLSAATPVTHCGGRARCGGAGRQVRARVRGRTGRVNPAWSPRGAVRGRRCRGGHGACPNACPESECPCSTALPGTLLMLRRSFLGGAALLLGAFAVAVVRARRSGAAAGEVAALMEREWFSAGKGFVAVLVGLAGSWAAACVGGTRSGLSESGPILFPSGLVAAFVVCRRDAVDDRHPLSAKRVALVAAPSPLGPGIPGWGRRAAAGLC